MMCRTAEINSKYHLASVSPIKVDASEFDCICQLTPSWKYVREVSWILMLTYEQHHNVWLFVFGNVSLIFMWSILEMSPCLTSVGTTIVYYYTFWKVTLS